MHVEGVNVVGLQLAQRVTDTNIQTATMDAAEIDRVTLSQFVSFVVCGEFGGKDNPFPDIPRREPLTQPCLGFFVVVVVGCIDEVTALSHVAVQQFEHLGLVHSSIKADHDLPMDMAPSWSGDTRMPAVEDRV